MSACCQPDEKTLPAIVTAPETLDAIRRHAAACYPDEACGAVTPAGFVPLPNRSPEPAEAFDCADDVAQLQISGELLAVVHSHPAGTHDRDRPTFPSSADMQAQMDMHVPWGLCASRPDHASRPFFWGTGVPVPPLLGRRFRHGPSGTDGRGDCYALIKDWFLVERGVELVEGPRDWEWWRTAEIESGNLYEENFARAGFVPVGHDQVQVGDVGLVMIPLSDVQGKPCPLRPNHGVVYVGQGEVIHHLPARLSLRAPLGEWNRLVKRWIRHASQFR